MIAQPPAATDRAHQRNCENHAWRTWHLLSDERSGSRDNPFNGSTSHNATIWVGAGSSNAQNKRETDQKIATLAIIFTPSIADRIAQQRCHAIPIRPILEHYMHSFEYDAHSDEAHEIRQPHQNHCDIKHVKDGKSATHHRRTADGSGPSQTRTCAQPSSACARATRRTF